jgi:AcrR family transcriptional regulator
MPAAPSPTIADARLAAVADPRERLLAAMATSIEQNGYRSSSVADVVRIARTSRRTFYEHFADRDACFLALFEATTGEVMRAIAGAVTFDGPWERQVEAAIAAYLDGVAARPALFQSFTHELPALGRAGVESARGVSERFVQLLVGLVEAGAHERPDLVARPLRRDTAVIIIGGLRELMITAVEEGRDVSALRAVATDAVKAIMRAAVVEPSGAP